MSGSRFFCIGGCVDEFRPNGDEKHASKAFQKSLNSTVPTNTQADPSVSKKAIITEFKSIQARVGRHSDHPIRDNPIGRLR